MSRIARGKGYYQELSVRAEIEEVRCLLDVRADSVFKVECVIAKRKKKVS